MQCLSAKHPFMIIICDKQMFMQNLEAQGNVGAVWVCGNAGKAD